VPVGDEDNYLVAWRAGPGAGERLCVCVDVGHARRARPPVCRRPARVRRIRAPRGHPCLRRRWVGSSPGGRWDRRDRPFEPRCASGTPFPWRGSPRSRRGRRARTRGDRSAGVLGHRRSEARRAPCHRRCQGRIRSTQSRLSVARADALASRVGLSLRPARAGTRRSAESCCRGGEVLSPSADTRGLSSAP
jgi:hypothetical protein